MEKQTFTAAQKLQEACGNVAFLAEQPAATRRVGWQATRLPGTGEKKSQRLQPRLKWASAKEKVFPVAWKRPELKRDKPSNCGTAALNQKQF